MDILELFNELQDATEQSGRLTDRINYRAIKDELGNMTIEVKKISQKKLTLDDFLHKGDTLPPLALKLFEEGTSILIGGTQGRGKTSLLRVLGRLNEEDSCTTKDGLTLEDEFLLFAQGVYTQNKSIMTIDSSNISYSLSEFSSKLKPKLITNTCFNVPLSPTFLYIQLDYERKIKSISKISCKFINRVISLKETSEVFSTSFEEDPTFIYFSKHLRPAEGLQPVIDILSTAIGRYSAIILDGEDRIASANKVKDLVKYYKEQDSALSLIDSYDLAVSTKDKFVEDLASPKPFICTTHGKATTLTFSKEPQGSILHIQLGQSGLIESLSELSPEQQGDSFILKTSTTHATYSFVDNSYL